MKGVTLAKAQREKNVFLPVFCAHVRKSSVPGGDRMKRRARRGSKEEGSGAVAWFDRSKEFILDSADASVTVQSDGLSLIFIWYPNQLCAQKDAERQRCAALKGVWIKWRYKKLTHLRCHCHRSTGTNQDSGRTRCTGYPLFLELLVRFWVNELRWTCLLYSRKKLSLKVSDHKVN